MGSGKSTVGKELARYLNLPFYDTDDLIVQKENRSIADIFAQSGETYFRELEHKTLLEISSTYDFGVFATGGGMPCFHNNIEIMNATGVSVFINASSTRIFNRIKNDQSRPLVADRSEYELLQYIREHLKERKSHYLQSEVVVRSIGTPLEIAKRIAKKIRHYIHIN